MWMQLHSSTRLSKSGKKVKRNFLLALLSLIAGCAPVNILNTFVPSDSYSVRRDVAYGKLDRNLLDIYTPKNAAPKKDVVIFIHGGSWQMGDKSEYLFVAESFTRRGYMAVVPNYHLAPEVKYPAFVEDTAAAINWVKRNIAQYGGNPERIFVVGHSAGAYNAVMVFALNKVNANDVRGVIGLAGPYDFLPLTDPKLQAIFAPAKPLKTMLPIHYAAQKFPPMLLMAGDKDADVSPKNTSNFAAKLKKSGNMVEAVYLPDLDHIDIITALSTPLKNKSVLDPLFAFIKAQ